MRWLLVAGAVILGVIVLVVLIGATLPRDHVAAMTARIDAAPEVVWSALTTPSAFPTWRSDVTRVELLPATAAGQSWREFSKHGSLTMQTEAADAPHRLVTRIADAGLPYGGAWEYRVDPDGAGASRVTIVERGSVYNPVFRFVSRFIMGHTSTIDAYLRQLGRRFGREAAPTIIVTGLEAHGT